VDDKYAVHAISELVTKDMSHSKLNLAILLTAAAIFVAPLAAQNELPEGPGREALKRVCTSCHEIDTVTGARYTRIGWRQNVDEMVSRGAEGSEKDLDAIVEYLVAHYGKLNVNTASAKELGATLGLTEQEARAIVAYRERNGDYKDFEQLKKTPGVSQEKLQAKRAQIAFSL
jgi:competence ComEA-like helix-hairpin-helix protein